MFKNCLEALNGTYIKVNVDDIDKPWYRTRKGDIAINVLGVCDRNKEFIFVLPGWEGFVSNSRLLRDVVTRPNGLKVPNGCCYLVDAGYTNGERFLAPHRGTRYHLSKWREGHTPTNHKEYFNIKHASARNVMERYFGVLKKCWTILRSQSFYQIKTQIRIITTCCLTHNLIRIEMSIDLVEVDYNIKQSTEDLTDEEVIGLVASLDEWTAFRDNMARSMFYAWSTRHGQ